MPPFRKFNNSCVHGAAAYSAYALGPIVHSPVTLILAGLICVYAGWFRQAYLASFLGGVIVAVVSWTFVGMLSLPEPGFGVFFMVPFALLVILPTVLAGYVIGKIIFSITHRRDKRAESDA
jgi:membrane-bound ClpP family serine protease